MENNKGYISLHRQILEHPLFQHPGMLRLFIYLLLSANHQTQTINWNGESVVVGRGQLITGRLVLAQKLNEKPTTIRNWLQVLSKRKILDIKSDNRYSLITIVKYDEYQSQEKNRTAKRPTEWTADGQQMDTNNNVNNENNNTNTLQTNFADDVNTVLKIFYEKVNPTLNFGNKTQRRTIQELINKYGYEKLIGMVEYACSVQGQRFAPVITNPIEFKNKLAQLVVYSKRQQERTNNIIDLDNL